MGSIWIRKNDNDDNDDIDGYKTNINSNYIFTDMEEAKGDRYTGIGIKRMKLYKCNLKIDELNKIREYFWNIKTNKKEKNWITWKVIRRAVLFDEVRASLLLEEHKIQPVNGCINHLIDEKGNEYRIPNYCINDPFFEKIISSDNDSTGETIKIKIYGCKLKEQSFILEVKNKINGKELKKEIIKHEQFEEEKEMRLFEGGIEIKDNDFLYQHKLNIEKPILVIMN